MLRRACLAVLASGVLVAMAGCTTFSSTIPTRSVPLEEMKTQATYDIVGDAVGTSTGGYLFGFIPINIERKTGAIGTLGLLEMQRTVSPVVRAAMYNAIEATQGADAMISPRWHIISRDYIIYKELTASVKGKAIRYNVSAK